jgi:hypothetical protein
MQCTSSYFSSIRLSCAPCSCKAATVALAASRVSIAVCNIDSRSRTIFNQRERFSAAHCSQTPLWGVIVQRNGLYPCSSLCLRCGLLVPCDAFLQTFCILLIRFVYHMCNLMCSLVVQIANERGKELRDVRKVSTTNYRILCLHGQLPTIAEAGSAQALDGLASLSCLPTVHSACGSRPFTQVHRYLELTTNRRAADSNIRKPVPANKRVQTVHAVHECVRREMRKCVLQLYCCTG